MNCEVNINPLLAHNLSYLDNEKITNRRVIANEFNKYFVSLASNTIDPSGIGLILSPITPFTEFLTQSNQSSTFFKDCSIKKLR